MTSSHSARKTLLMLTAGIMTLGASGQNAKNTAPQRVERVDYQFTQSATPDSLAIAGTTAFVIIGNDFHTLSGRPILENKKKHLVDVAVYPAGNYMTAIIRERGNKPNQAFLYDRVHPEEYLKKYNNKQLGMPKAVAYTPDGLRLAVATDTAVQFVDVTKLLPSGNPVKIDYKNVDRIKISNNMYYLAVAEPTQVAVYNLETGRRRAAWDFETLVNDFCFNADASRFYVITDDGILTVYDTRTFLPVQTLEDLGEGLAVSINNDGKYAAVLESPEKISVINLLSPADRHTIEVEGGHSREISFIPDSKGDVILLYTAENAARGRRLPYLKPNYGKLVNDEVNEKMNDWLKMMPGETMEEYNARVNDESRNHMRRMFEQEASTRFAPDLASMAAVTLGSYDRAAGVLAVDFDNMPSIFIPVPESDLGGFSDAGTLEFRNSKYGVMADDNFELVYAEVFNSANGKTYVYDNIDRVPLNFMADADNVVSIELIQQQQMEELRLQELRQEIMEAAKKQNVLTDNTSITVDSRIEPDFDADGNRILNYIVSVTYDVAPELSVTEDFKPGKYVSTQSPAANAMLQLVKQAFEGDLAPYLKEGKKLQVTISGTADALPIMSKLIYNGEFGDIDNQPYYNQDKMTTITMENGQRINLNEELAFLRAYGVKDFLENNVEHFNDMNRSYRYNIAVSEEKGSANRRINVDFTFVDAY
ncbi:MAG: WD40 repeat domain-containing protein [Duncaniella sp.]|nr:WD40 repeat domain-containing protein [Duncaniella sp.]